MKKLILCILVVLPSIWVFSQNAKLNLSKGRDLTQKEEYNSALYYFNLAIKDDSTCIDAYFERAHANKMLGDYKNALNDFNYVLKKAPNYANCYFGIGDINDIFLDDKYRAIECYSKGIELSIKIGDNDLAGVGYFKRAVLKQKLGDKSGYMNDLKKGAALDNVACKSILELLDNMNK